MPFGREASQPPARRRVSLVAALALSIAVLAPALDYPVLGTRTVALEPFVTRPLAEHMVDPASRPGAQLGVPRQHWLIGPGCHGHVWADLDGSFWVLHSAEDSDEAAGAAWSTIGTITLVAPNVAVFRTKSGAEVTLLRRAGSAVMVPCLRLY